MATLMARGQALLARKGVVAAGVSVTYTRDSSAAALTAWVGNTDRDAAGLAGGEYVVRVRTDRDYLLRYADLAAFGEPQPGDTLTETVGGETEVYEVIQVIKRCASLAYRPGASWSSSSNRKITSRSDT